jgi:predicted transcriptional regulator of viral defense system
LRYADSAASDWLRLKGVPSFFRPDQLRDFGLTPDHLPALLRYGAVERVCRGLYHRVDGPVQHYLLALACALSPDSIVCLHSALQIHGIKSLAASTTRDTATVWLAIRHRARTPRLHDLPVRIVRFSSIAWSFRVIETEFDGVPARITTPARTVADCFRLGRLAGARAGIEAFNDAIDKGLVTLAELARIEWALPCRRLRALLALYDLRESGEIGERLRHRPAQ